MLSDFEEMFYPMDKYIVELYVKFANNNPFGIKNIQYSCIHYAESGSAIKKSEGIKYIAIEPNGYVYRKLNLGFKHDDLMVIKCKCTGFTKEQ